MVRKHPPARVELGIASQWQTKAAKANFKMVNAALTTFVGGPETPWRYAARMDSLFIHGRASLIDASSLIEQHGEDAGFEAAVRAERSRDDGNVTRFCHWRQIERLIATLSSEEVQGTIH